MGKTSIRSVSSSSMYSRSAFDFMQPSESPTSELPAIGFLNEVSSEHRAFLACFGKFLRPRPGDILIEEGAQQESLYVILSGSLHITSNSGERLILLAALREGDSLGEVNLFDPGTASATAVCHSPGLVWTITRDELNGFLEADPAAGVSVLKGLLRQVAWRIRTMNEKLATAEQRASLHNFWTIGLQG